MTTMTSQLRLILDDRASRPARRASRAMRDLQGDVHRTARASGVMAMGLGRTALGLAAMGGAAIGAGAGVSSALTSAMDLEDALASLRKVSSLNEQELAAMGDRAIELSGKMPIAASEILNLMAAASQFGIAGEDLEEFSLLASKASVAFDMDPSATAQRLSELRNGFKLTVAELGDLADVLNTTADNAGTSEERLIDFLGRTASTANDIGVTADQMAVLGATMSELGISAERSSTATNKILTTLADLGSKKDATKVLDQLGGNGYSKKLQKEFFETPVEALEKLADITEDMDAETRSGFFIDLFGREHADEASALLNSFDRVEEGMRRLDGGQFLGSVDKTFETFASTTRNKLATLGNNLSNVGAMLGAKALPGIVDFSEKLSDTIGSLDERVTVFDKAKGAISGFMDGLGSDGERIAGIYDTMWDSIFGSTEDFEADTQRLSDTIEWMTELGEGARGFANDVGVVSGKISELLSNLKSLVNFGDSFDSEGFWNFLYDRSIFGFVGKLADNIERVENAKPVGERNKRLADEDQVMAVPIPRPDIPQRTAPAFNPSAARSIEEAGRTAREAQENADGLGRSLDEVGSKVVTPQIETNPLERAQAILDNITRQLQVIDGTAASGLSQRGGNSGGVAGARARGGPAEAGLPYLVNEETPRSEIFVPSASGAVLNVPQAQRALAGFAERAARRSGNLMDGFPMEAMRGGMAALGSAAPARSGPDNVSIAFGDIIIPGGSNASAGDLAAELGRQVGLQLRSQFSDGGI